MTNIREIIDRTTTKSHIFKPTEDLYIKTCINRKRFAKLYRGEQSPTIIELYSIAEYFGIEIVIISKPKEQNLH